MAASYQAFTIDSNETACEIDRSGFVGKGVHGGLLAERANTPSANDVVAYSNRSQHKALFDRLTDLGSLRASATIGEIASIASWIYRITVRDHTLHPMRDSHYPTSGNPIVFFDFETTGLCSKNDSIIEIAAVKYVPGADSHPHMAHLIAIDRPLPRFITKLTGITDDMLRADGRRMDEVLDEFIDFIGDHPVVAFNINFDARFLNAAVERHGRQPVRNVGHCALARARAAWPELPSHKLVHMAKHLDLDVGVAHRALNDTLLALEVYFRSFQVDCPREPERRTDKTVAAGSPSVIPTISGPRQFRIEVLGTRRYQEAFEAVCGPRSARGAALDIQVQLRVESNSNAVRVLLHEEVVGNLAPRIALDFRRAIIDGDLAEFRHFECSAKIRDGKVCDSPDDGHYVMWLDIPQDDD